MSSLEVLMYIILVAFVAGAIWLWRTGRPVPWTRVSRPHTGAPMLRGIEGPYQGREVLLRFQEDQPSFLIGRTAENVLQIDGMLVSRRHAQIAYQHDQYVLYDCDSTNGTYVNGRRIDQHMLQNGDQIRIGPAAFIFLEPGRTPQPTPEPVPVTTPPPAARPRKETFRDYLIQETLGQGGIATVYRAVHRHNKDTVAVKILRQADAYLRHKFEAEGEVASILDHPNIVKIFGYGEIEDVFYIIMEYLPGGTLRQRLSTYRLLPLEIAIPIVGQICEALDYAHGRGVIHRDIKPENIMFATDSDVKLVDFGIAKVASAVTRTTAGTILGTPYYMSVEQARGDRVIPASDLYSLGVVFYEMVTGRVPFTGDGLQVVKKHLGDAPIPPRQVNPAVPPHVEEVIFGALEKDARRRFSSAAEMAQAVGYSFRRNVSSSVRMGSVGRGSSLQTARGTALEPQLVVISGNAQGRIVKLSGGETIVGRDLIAPQDDYMSGRHARVWQQEGRFWLQDLESRNGTYHNEVRIFEPVLLRPGDKIRLGRTELRFEIV